MTQAERVTFQNEFPEAPAWMIDPARNYTLQQARELMELRRRAFPKTILNCVLREQYNAHIVKYTRATYKGRAS